MLGLSAGASAPEVLVDGVLDWLAVRFDLEIDIEETARETVTFKLPPGADRAGLGRLTRRRRAWPSIPPSTRTTSAALLADFDLGAAHILQGHRRGDRELQLPAGGPSAAASS